MTQLFGFDCLGPLAIARALAVDPPLLLMDEPTPSLDGAGRSSPPP